MIDDYFFVDVPDQEEDITEFSEKELEHLEKLYGVIGVGASFKKNLPVIPEEDFEDDEYQYDYQEVKYYKKNDCIISDNDNDYYNDYYKYNNNNNDAFYMPLTISSFLFLIIVFTLSC